MVDTEQIIFVKTLKNIFKSDQILEPVNGHIRAFNSGTLIIGHLNDFKTDLSSIPRGEYLIVFDKKPERSSKITVKTINCYSLRVEVVD